MICIFEEKMSQFYTKKNTFLCSQKYKTREFYFKYLKNEIG